jgi:hypothetical protein
MNSDTSSSNTSSSNTPSSNTPFQRGAEKSERVDQTRDCGRSMVGKGWGQSQDGSLTILMISFFFITLLLSFVIIDISEALLAKRELINIGEAAISRAAHHVDVDRYYSGNRGEATTSFNGSINLLPIDCQAAADSMESEIASTSLRGHEISITSFSCLNDLLHASISSYIRPTLQLPFLAPDTASTLFEISATLSVSNLIAHG